MDEDPALDGFVTVVDREAAHAPIIEFVVERLGVGGGTVIDLGCGSGALLAQICQRRPGVRPVGVEHDVDRAVRARDRLSGFGGEVVVGDVLDIEEWSSSAWESGPAAVALLMPGRLIEARADGRPTEQLISALATNVHHVVVYAYGDWLTRHGDLAGLAAAAGVGPVAGIADATSGAPLWQTCAELTFPATELPQR